MACHSRWYCIMCPEPAESSHEVMQNRPESAAHRWPDCGWHWTWLSQVDCDTTSQMQSSLSLIEVHNRRLLIGRSSDPRMPCKLVREGELGKRLSDRKNSIVIHGLFKLCTGKLFHRGSPEEWNSVNGASCFSCHLKKHARYRVSNSKGFGFRRSEIRLCV